MNRAELLGRTRSFAIDTIRFCSRLPRGYEYQVIGRQLLRAATSVGANYRAVCRAKSRADFVSKLSIVEEEADECLYWFELLQDLGVPDAAKLGELSSEATQFVAISVASKKTARRAKPVPSR